MYAYLEIQSAYQDPKYSTSFIDFFFSPLTIYIYIPCKGSMLGGYHKIKFLLVREHWNDISKTAY